MNKRNQSPWSRVVLSVAFMACIAFAGISYGGEASEKYTVDGKEFWSETVDKEPGNYWVHWGTDKIKWEPKNYHTDEIKEQGPIFYARWDNKLREKGYFPFNISWDERLKMSAKKFWDIWYIMSPNVLIAGPDGAFFQDTVKILLRSPDDKKKYSVEGIEFLRGFRKSVDFPDNQLLWKYIIVQTKPQDAAGLGYLQIVYSGDKKDDSFIYFPTVRKVRRLASASRQDRMIRTLWRQEDNALCKPIHNYKYIGKEIMKDPGPDVPGFSTGGLQGEVTYEGKEHKTVDGVGEPCQIVEVTPYRDDWWFGKKILHVGIFSGKYWVEMAYDKEGRKIRCANYQAGIYYLPGEGKDIKGSVGIPHWDRMIATEYTTGYWHNMYSDDVSILQKDVPPESIFVEGTLLKEITTLNWYR
jgi:hypothetical protein